MHIGEEQERTYLYVADDIGFLKVYDLTYIIKKTGLKPSESYPKTKISFNVKRKENVDCTSFANALRRE